MSFWSRVVHFFEHPIETIREAISEEPSPIEIERPERAESQMLLGPSEYFGSEVPDFARSDHGQIVSWGTFDRDDRTFHFTDGPLTTDVLEYESVDAYIVRIVDDEGVEHYYTIHDEPTEDFDLDDAIERILEKYG